MTNEVTEMFRAIIEDRPDYKVEKVVDGYTGFLFLDKDGMPLVAMHWEHRFNHMVSRYNEIYKVQMRWFCNKRKQMGLDVALQESGIQSFFIEFPVSAKIT